MARPTKRGLDYFSLDVTLDDSVELVEAEHGLIGFAILIKIWQKIYSEGYYIDWKDDNQMLFSRKINSTKELVSSVVSTCIQRGLFSKDMFDRYEILTSKSIQTRYLAACKNSKRAVIPFIQSYSLVIPEETPFTPEETPVSPGESTQIKEKKNKENKTKVNEIKQEETVVVVVDNSRNIYREYEAAGFGTISPVIMDQLTDLETDYGFEWTKDALIEAAASGVRTIKYTTGILKNWKSRGRNAPKPEYRRSKEPVKPDFEERQYNYSDLEKQLLGRA